MIEASSRRLSMVLADRCGTARRPRVWSSMARSRVGLIPRVGEAVTETVEPGGIAEVFSSTPSRGITSKSAPVRRARARMSLMLRHPSRGTRPCAELPTRSTPHRCLRPAAAARTRPASCARWCAPSRRPPATLPRAIAQSCCCPPWRCARKRSRSWPKCGRSQGNAVRAGCRGGRRGPDRCRRGPAHRSALRPWMPDPRPG